MSKNAEQHGLFREGFHAMESYFTEVKKYPSLYDVNKPVEMIEKFDQVFCMYLREEIDTFAPEKPPQNLPRPKGPQGFMGSNDALGNFDF